MKEFGADIRHDLIELVNTISKMSYPNSTRLKIFFYNLLMLQEVRDNLVQIKENYSIATGLDPDQLEPLSMKKLVKQISTEYFEQLEKRGIFIDFSKKSLLISLIYKKNPRGIEARYNRLLNLVTHLFNTPTTYLAIRLNIDKTRLKNKIGEEFERLSDSLVEKYTWRDKLLKAIKHYKETVNLSEVDANLLKFFESFLKVTNTVELLGKNLLTINKKWQIIKNLGETMTSLFTGLLQYKDLKERPNAGILEIVTELMNILFDIAATFGKILSKESGKAITYGITEALAPLYVLGIETLNNTEGKQIELLRNKLAKLLKERHKLIDMEIESGTTQLLYEGENFWNALLIERVLCNSKQEIFQILGIPITNPTDEFDYEAFLKPVNEEKWY
ncbi:MAG: hypothetical protein QMD82_08510 [bacterium]|nr:hypothetical protein [bacterium]